MKLKPGQRKPKLNQKKVRILRRSKMEAINRGLRLLFLMSILIGGMAVGSHADVLEAKDAEKAPDLSFVDASDGLPSTGQWRQGLAFYDMNGDSHLDIIATPPRNAKEGNKTPVIWYGDGKGKWVEKRSETAILCDYGDVAAADFDCDGIADMALAMHGIGMKGLKGTGKNGYVDFSGGMLPSGKFTSRSLVSADFNNDGIPDIAAVSEAQFGKSDPIPAGLVVCLRMDNTWKCQHVGDEDTVRGLFADKLSVGDVTGDGNKDIAVGSLNHARELIVWIGDGKGGFTPFNKGLTREHHYLSVAFSDINRDGRDDLVAIVTGFGRNAFLGLKVFLSGPDGFTEMCDGLPTRELFFAVDACDLNGDGIPEIAAGTADGGVQIFTLKDRRWDRLTPFGLPEKGLKRIWNIYCVDCNGDGRKDIVLNFADGQNDTGGIRVFLNVQPK
jgi:hypothetical protein